MLNYRSLALANLASFFSFYSVAVCIALAFYIVPFNANADDPLPVPDHETYGAFLLDDWKASRPTLVMMLDPYCPYCIRSLQQREKLRKYNVFLFWTPILGKASEIRVAEILECELITGAEVVSAVIARKAPECARSKGPGHVKSNQVMANAYDPQSVPAYYFGGQRVGLSQLSSYVDGIGSLAGNVGLDWERYVMFKIFQPSNRASQVGVILPKSFQHWDKLLEQIAGATQLDWYVVTDFKDGTTKEFCEVTDFCGETSLREFRNKREELIALFGLSEITTPQFILNGKLLNKQEAEKVLGVGNFPG
jgi:thiol-disulfide isomerase/thioredoxin